MMWIEISTACDARALVNLDELAKLIAACFLGFSGTIGTGLSWRSEAFEARAQRSSLDARIRVGMLQQETDFALL